MEEFKQHEVSWTPEKSRRFWNSYSSNKAMEGFYFSKQVGASILKQVKSKIKLKGEILDFGCGPGFFLQELAKNKIKSDGLDFSEESLKLAASRLGDSPYLGELILAKGIPTPVRNSSYDSVFFIETLEHILDEDLPNNLKELNRALKIGGHLIITVPNEENLDKSKVCCPDCGAVFHRVQHVRTFSAQSISELFKQYGFRAVFCKAVMFRSPSALNFFRNLVQFFYGKFYKARYPHLLLIAEKISN
ncbi:MAG: class I SAM-dependent methyltransferase [Candidatus Pacebacteria bacterium]|nr:class I SAM-dependent methyltransferase [Candidatus Paceibacterota bacterium]